MLPEFIRFAGILLCVPLFFYFINKRSKWADILAILISVVGWFCLINPK